VGFILLEYITIGKIINTHGIKGEVKVMPLTDNPDRYYDLEWAYVGNDDNCLQVYNVEKVRVIGNNLVLLKFKEVNDMNNAQLIKGLFIKVDRKHTVKLEPGTYLICDIVGCNVYALETQNELGTVVDVIKTPSNDVYVVKNKEGKEILIPALKSVVKEVLIEERIIRVILPEGLV